MVTVSAMRQHKDDALVGVAARLAPLAHVSSNAESRAPHYTNSCSSCFHTMSSGQPYQYLGLSLDPSTRE